MTEQSRCCERDYDNDGNCDRHPAHPPMTQTLSERLREIRERPYPHTCGAFVPDVVHPVTCRTCNHYQWFHDIDTLTAALRERDEEIERLKRESGRDTSSDAAMRAMTEGRF